MTAPSTLSELVESYVLTHRRTPVSQRVGRQILGRFVKEVGDIDAADLSRDHVEAWWRAVEPAAAAESRRSYYGTVRAFLSWLRDGEIISGNPIRVIARPPAVRSSPATMRPAEVAAIRAACVDSRDRLLVELAWGLGLRCIEISRLRIEEVDWDRRVVVIHGKGGHDDELPLTDSTAGAIADYYRDWPPPATGFVVRNLASGRTGQGALRGTRGIGSQTISDRIIGIAKRAGVKNAPWDGKGAHGLRRTCATELLESGANIREVQAVLRHVTLSSTEHYLRRTTTDRMRELLDDRVS